MRTMYSKNTQIRRRYPLIAWMVTWEPNRYAHMRLLCWGPCCSDHSLFLKGGLGRLWSLDRWDPALKTVLWYRPMCRGMWLDCSRVGWQWSRFRRCIWRRRSCRNTLDRCCCRTRNRMWEGSWMLVCIQSRTGPTVNLDCGPVRLQLQQWVGSQIHISQRLWNMFWLDGCSSAWLDGLFDVLLVWLFLWWGVHKI